jgi:hypothetical protein
MALRRIEIVGRERLRSVGVMMAAEADARRLKLELGRNFRIAAEPITTEQKERIRGAEVTHSSDVSMREAIAGGLKLRTRFTTVSAGVSISAGTITLRKFTQAPRRMNARNGFRHPLFGNRDRWYSQKGDPGWFSEPPMRHIEEFELAALQAIIAMELRLAARTRALGGV